jgi:eukaryotic-like serine/threonine-protein kinase
MTQAPQAGLIGGRYRLEQRLGAGGMGEVWQAEHVALGSRVAIKFLHRSLAESERSRRRFATEARVMAQLSSRHVARVFDFGIECDQRPYLVMELLDGETLGQKLAREGSLSPGATSRLLGQAARGLERAHSFGVIHRDFKPENVLLVVDEDAQLVVKVLDFGMAKLLGPDSALLPAGNDDDDEARGEEGAAPRAGPGKARDPLLTPIGRLLGTPRYMAPEQLRGEPSVGAAVDVWSFGIVAFECLTGSHPFRASTLAALLRRVLKGRCELASALKPALPPGFDAWFARCCAQSPGARFPSLRAAADELTAVLEPAGAKPRLPLWTAALLCCAAAAAAASPALLRLGLTDGSSGLVALGSLDARSAPPAASECSAPACAPSPALPAPAAPPNGAAACVTTACSPSAPAHPLAPIQPLRPLRAAATTPASLPQYYPFPEETPEHPLPAGFKSDPY